MTSRILGTAHAPGHMYPDMTCMYLLKNITVSKCFLSVRSVTSVVSVVLVPMVHNCQKIYRI